MIFKLLTQKMFTAVSTTTDIFEIRCSATGPPGLADAMSYIHLNY